MPLCEIYFALRGETSITTCVLLPKIKSTPSLYPLFISRLSFGAGRSLLSHLAFFFRSGFYTINSDRPEAAGSLSLSRWKWNGY